MTAIPEANVAATVYEVCCLPAGWKARRHFTVTVEYCGHDQWVARRDGDYYRTDATHEWDSSSPSGRSDGDDFPAGFRMTQDEAVTVAKRIALTVTAGKYTVADALEHGPDWA